MCRQNNTEDYVGLKKSTWIHNYSTKRTHTCAFRVTSFSSISFDPNSTPMVDRDPISCGRPVNSEKSRVLPTPLSPTSTNLYWYSCFSHGFPIIPVVDHNAMPRENWFYLYIFSCFISFFILDLLIYFVILFFWIFDCYLIFWSSDEKRKIN